MAFTRYLITCKPAQGNCYEPFVILFIYCVMHLLCEIAGLLCVQTGSRVTCWTCCKMIAMSYLLAFILAAMPLLGFGNYEVEPFGLSCTLDWIGKDRGELIQVRVSHYQENNFFKYVK